MLKVIKRFVEDLAEAAGQLLMGDRGQGQMIPIKVEVRARKR